MTNTETTPSVEGNITRGGWRSARWGVQEDEHVDQEGRGYTPMSREGGALSSGKGGGNTPLSENIPANNLEFPATVSSDIDDLEKKSLEFFKNPEKKLSTGSSNRAKFLVPISEYDPEKIAEALVDYFVAPDTETTTEFFTDSEGNVTESTRQYPRPIPLLTTFFRLFGLTSTRFRDLVSMYPETLIPVIEICEETMEEYLIRRGLVGEYKSEFAQFVAVNKTKMKYKKDVTIQTINVNDLLDQIQEARVPRRIE